MSELDCNFLDPFNINEENIISISVDSDSGIVVDPTEGITTDLEEEKWDCTVQSLKNRYKMTAYRPRMSAGYGVVADPGTSQFYGEYIVLGDTCYFWSVFLFRSGISFNGGTGYLIFELPVAPWGRHIAPSLSVNCNTPVNGMAVIQDASAPTAPQAWGMWTHIASSNIPNAVALCRDGGQVVDNSTPWSWAAGDNIILQGSYRVQL